MCGVKAEPLFLNQTYDFSSYTYYISTLYNFFLFDYNALGQPQYWNLFERQ